MKSIVCIKETDLEPGKGKIHILLRLISFEFNIYSWSPEVASLPELMPMSCI
jgi:hypothetical protein